jgi:hypothetical protein
MIAKQTRRARLSYFQQLAAEAGVTTQQQQQQQHVTNSGTDGMILKIFFPKKLAKKWHFLRQILLIYAKQLSYIALVFQINTTFLPKLCKNHL